METTAAGASCGQHGGVLRYAVNEYDLHVAGRLNALLCGSRVNQVDQNRIVARIACRLDELEHLAGVVLRILRCQGDARLFRRSLCAGFQRAQELVAQRP